MVNEISNRFSGQNIPLDETMVDEVNDHGVVLANGTELSYKDLSRILLELTPNVLQSLPTLRAHSGAFDHVCSMMKETGRLFMVFANTAK